VSGNFDVLLAPKDRFLECQMKIVTQISPSPRSPMASRGEPKSLTEKLLKDVKRISETAEVEPATRSFEPRMSEAIIGVSFLGIGENLIGLIDLLETRLSIGRITDVRMPLTRFVAIRLLDVPLRGRPIDPKNLVIVKSRCHNNSSNPAVVQELLSFAELPFNYVFILFIRLAADIPFAC
jgi:hypothetical protein